MLRYLCKFHAWQGLAAAIILTSCVNVLALTGPFFMIEVYDRVIPSKSVPTLVALIGLAGFLYAFSGFIDVARARIMARLAGLIDAQLAPMVFRINSLVATAAAPPNKRPSSDLDQIRTFMSGQGLLAIFDLPWCLLYLLVCYLIHPYLGLVALGATLLLVLLTVGSHVLVAGRSADYARAHEERDRLEDEIRRNIESITAMGMSGQARTRWIALNDEHARIGRQINDVAGGASATSKTIRIAVQSGVLALGAYLVVDSQLTGGMILACSVIVSRALAPAEQVIAQWHSFATAFRAWKRLRTFRDLVPTEVKKTELPPPSHVLNVNNLSVAAPGSTSMVLRSVSFALQAGNVLGVIGPSASGKSSLARALVGAWPAASGEIRLDGATLPQWASESLGAHVGYLPQSVELFEGTIFDNISRFRPNVPDSEVLAAARAADVHEMIVRMEKGYQTPVGEGGARLSAGQRQRIALARALFGDPFLVVLDEPNSNLDIEGEAALAHALLTVKRRNGVVVIVAHRPEIMKVVDFVMMLRKGQSVIFGPREAVLARVTDGAQVGTAPLKVVEGHSGS